MEDDVLEYDLPAVVVPPGESRNIVSDPLSPQGDFYPHGLKVDPEAARHLTVSDVRVGRNSQFVGAGALPCDLFAASPPFRFLMNAMRPGSRITVSATNTGPSDVTFRGTVLGSRKPPARDLLYAVSLGRVEVRTPTMVVTLSSQVALRPRVLFVPDHVLADFDVASLKQGKYLDVPEAASVDYFLLSRSNLLHGGAIEFKPFAEVGAGSPVSVTVTRTVPDESPRYFTGAILGTPATSSKRPPSP